MTTEYKNFMNGQWSGSVSGKTFENINPADTGDGVGSFQYSVEEDVNQAIDAAEAAFEHWNQIPMTSREIYLYEAADILGRRSEEIARAMTREMGKTLAESKGELGRGIQILRYFAGEARRLCGETYPSDNPATFLYTLREPLGIVGIIAPWNFPLAIPLWKLAPAIVYGNTAILKPSVDAPWTSVLIGEIFEEAKLPAGVLNIITGTGSQVGKALVDSERIQAITFTGSCEIGRKLLVRCGELNKKVQLEMGGHNPVIVMADADVDHAVSITIAGAFLSAGQKCTSTRRVIVHHSLLDEFTEKLVAGSKNLRIGDGARDDTQIGPIINQSQLDVVLAGIQQGIKEGAELAWGGKRLVGNGYDRGFFIQPAVFSGVKPNMTIAREEIFGPVVDIMTFNELDEALEIANSVTYGLSAAIVTRDIKSAARFVKGIKAGIVHVNSQTAGAECHVPFGGMKDSSSGSREQGKAAMQFFTQLKTVYFDPPKS